MADNGHPSKRLKSSHGTLHQGYDIPLKDACTLASLNRSITPPLRRRLSRHPDTPSPYTSQEKPPLHSRGIPSPIQLTHIRDFATSSGNNTDAIKLRDILGDPLIKECWQFNYMFDVDFLMSQFDEDVRNLVKVKIIHGSWKRESPNRVRIDENCRRYPNVEPIVAYMPEPFGTHHSKMMILLRHDDQAQVVIHTANMIAGDWANMCQAVWRSPRLPIVPVSQSGRSSASLNGFGTGNRFKRDLLAYLEMYGHKKTGPLIEQLEKYDFTAVRAGLIASVPSRQAIDELDSEKRTLWGWPALKDTIRQIPLNKGKSTAGKKPQIVIQISSVATLGQTDKWLKETFFAALSPTPSRSLGLFSPRSNPPAKFSIIFPTPDEIRRSLNGYGSGGSIHMKLQSAAQQKQLEYLRPYLCHWAGDTSDGGNKSTEDSTSPGREGSDIKKESESFQEHTTIKKDGLPIREAGRSRAAPHIKTYIRFSDADMATIDWAMVTSANLSLQAWGAAANGKNEIRVCSWEIGVLIWPGLFVDGNEDNTENGMRREWRGKETRVDNDEYAAGDGIGAVKSVNDRRTTVMAPCFKQDMPQVPENSNGSSTTTYVGLRMPYDLPLSPYTPHDQPWCATASYSEPDWLGQTWEEEL